MANRRMIASDIWRDEFFGGLDVTGRLLWIGLITTEADDQGRMVDNTKLIRSDIFPFDDISTADIENRLALFAQAGKALRYEADGKRLIQLINWWSYQTPSWASASKYKAPDGWIDREKYHGVGNKIESRNWDSKGGFVVLHSQLPSPLPRPINEGESESDGEGEYEGKGEGETSQQPAAEPDQFSVIQSALEKSGIIVNGPKDIKTITELVSIEAIDADIVTGVTWKKEQSGDTPVYLSSVIGPIKTAVSKRKQAALPKPVIIDPRHAALDRALERLNGKLS